MADDCAQLQVLPCARSRSLPFAVGCESCDRVRALVVLRVSEFQHVIFFSFVRGVLGAYVEVGSAALPLVLGSTLSWSSALSRYAGLR